jgi:hypothetical protein
MDVRAVGMARRMKISEEEIVSGGAIASQVLNTGHSCLRKGIGMRIRHMWRLAIFTAG